MADLCDHPLSHTRLISARRVSLRKILDLNDENFRRFVQNGCRWPEENREIGAELVRLNHELAALRSILSRWVDDLPAGTPR